MQSPDDSNEEQNNNNNNNIWKCIRNSLQLKGWKLIELIICRYMHLRRGMQRKSMISQRTVSYVVLHKS